MTTMRSADSWASEVCSREEYTGEITLARLIERIQAKPC